MAGTIEGGRKAAKTNLDKYGKAFYQEIGAKGGAKSTGGGFGYGEIGREKARVAGSIGGTKSRRGPAKYYTYKGKQMSITAIAREMGVARATAYKRLEIS
jgi:general stress protein YciG